MKVLVFDTESTGLPKYGKDHPADHPDQPFLAALAFGLYDGSPSNCLAQAHYLIRPEGWVMPPELPAKLGNGLTQERLEREGVPVAEVLPHFVKAHDEADLLVAFGITFDTKIMRGALRRNDYGDRYQDKPTFCVQRTCTKLCAIPPTENMKRRGPNTFKTPTLGEAVQILLGQPHHGAHTALADCDATARLFFWLVENGHVPTGTEEQAEVSAPVAARAAVPVDDPTAFLS